MKTILLLLLSLASLLAFAEPAPEPFPAQAKKETEIMRACKEIYRENNIPDTLKIKTKKGLVAFKNGKSNEDYFAKACDEKRKMVSVENITSFETSETYLVFLETGQKLKLTFGDAPVFSPSEKYFSEWEVDLEAQYRDTGLAVWENVKGQWKQVFSKKEKDEKNGTHRCGFNFTKWTSDTEADLTKDCFYFERDPDDESTPAFLYKLGTSWIIKESKTK